MNENLFMSPSPHIKSDNYTQKIMLNVIIATIPAIIASAIIFGLRSLLLILITVLSCVVSEYFSQKIMKKDNTINDLSAVVTGILLAFNLPVNIKFSIAIFGGIIAIVVTKQMFGGIGQNFVNPAICARIILMVSFPSAMSSWPVPYTRAISSADMITSATPLAKTAITHFSYLDLFLGNRPGCLGEVCALALILGGIYLILKKVISPTIPLCFIGTVFVLTAILGKDPIFHILSGGLLLGAIFMATDYVTSPITFKGKIIFAVGCGIITVLIRIYGSLPEGVSFSILLMNILVPHIENLTLKKQKVVNN